LRGGAAANLAIPFLAENPPIRAVLQPRQLNRWLPRACLRPDGGRLGSPDFAVYGLGPRSAGNAHTQRQQN
jgi:hypothetical protein